jgi:hypothetical protein
MPCKIMRDSGFTQGSIEMPQGDSTVYTLFYDSTHTTTMHSVGCHTSICIPHSLCGSGRIPRPRLIRDTLSATTPPIPTAERNSLAIALLRRSAFRPLTSRQLCSDECVPDVQEQDSSSHDCGGLRCWRPRGLRCGMSHVLCLASTSTHARPPLCMGNI